MQRKFAVAKLMRRRWLGCAQKCVPAAVLASAIVLGPAGGISGQQSAIRTSLRATLTVSDSGSLSVARVAGEAATGPLKTVAVHPWCSPSCLVFIDREPGVTGSPHRLRGSGGSTPERLLVTPETDTARLALPAGGDGDAATLVIYF